MNPQQLDSKVQLDDKIPDPLSVILSGNLVSSGVLTAVLESAKDPQKLIFFCNPKLAPICIKLIQEQGNDSEPRVFSHFGLLCIRILALSLHSLILKEAGVLSQFINQCPREIGLEEYAIAALADKIRATGEEYISAPIRTGIVTPIALPVTHAQSLVLLEYIHRERCWFLSCRYKFPELSRGWSVLLFPVWQALYDHKRSHARDMSAKLADLIFRYVAGPIGYEKEVQLVNFMVVTTFMKTIDARVFDYFICCFNRRDSEHALQAVTARLSAGTLPLSTLVLLFDWVIHSSSFDQTDLIPPLFEAAFNYVWEALATPDDTPLVVLRVCDTVWFATSLFRCAL
ncbi:hypothetical protein RhiJN_08226 [Ceratobasidium sp. AG-Ba]|nr:hypothetical protein RhiJN_08226 [Ceratobasidium sp. AG-Ba]